MEKILSNRFHVSSGYLRGLAYDHVLIVGILLLALTSGYIVHTRPDLFMMVLLADLWFLGYHHVIATFTKLAATKQDREDNNFLIYKLPFIVLGAVAALSYFIGIWVVATIYFFWQWYHYTRQSYGISVFYARKSGGLSQVKWESRLEYAAIWAMPLWGILNRCSQGWKEFLFLPFWAPPVPDLLTNIVGVIAVSVMVVWVAKKLYDFYQGKLAYAPFLFVLSHNLLFYIAYVFIADITYGWLVVNIWHNAQYILFVWLFNQNRFSGEKGQELSSVMSWLCQPKIQRIIAYFGVSIIVASLVYGLLMMGINVFSQATLIAVSVLNIIVFQTINFHHYVVDGLIWKARKKANQKIMKIPV